MIAFGVTATRCFCPFYWVLSLLHDLAGTVRGVGKGVPPMLILILSLCVFRVGWILLVTLRVPAVGGVFALYPVS